MTVDHKLIKSCQWLCFQCEIIDPIDVAALAKTVKRTLATYGTPALKEMIKNCMAQDLSWKVRDNDKNFL